MYMCNKLLVPFSSLSWLTKLSRGPAPAYLLIKARRLAKYAMKLSTVTPPMKWSTFDNKEVTTSSRNWFYQEEWSNNRLSWHIKKACWHCKVVLCILCKELWGRTKLRKQKGQGLSEEVPPRSKRPSKRRRQNCVNWNITTSCTCQLYIFVFIFIFIFYIYIYICFCTCICISMPTELCELEH